MRALGVLLWPLYVIGAALMWALDRLGTGGAALGLIERAARARLGGFADYEPTEHDVVVCVFHKSGTNWALQICHQIAHKGRGEYAHIHDVIPWPDQMRPGFSIPLADGSPLADSPTGLRVIKTHLDFDRVPYSPAARYVCVVRDPKDVVVSAYHFLRSAALGALLPSVRIAVEGFTADRTLDEPGSWPECTASYWKERDRDNVLLLTFEDMRRDLPAAVRSIADFLGIALSEDEFEAVCEKSSFAYMSSIDERFYPGPVTPFGSTRGKMVRRGQSGASAELLSAEQQQRIDDYARLGLECPGSDFPYDELYGSEAGKV